MSVINVETRIVQLTQTLLDSIASGDWATYVTLCAQDMSCIEPETQGSIVSGLDFHKFFFDLPSDNKSTIKLSSSVTTSIASPVVRVLSPDGSSAMIAYTRVVQKNVGSEFTISKAAETRIWQKNTDGQWKHIHFHRSTL